MAVFEAIYYFMDHESPDIQNATLQVGWFKVITIFLNYYLVAGPGVHLHPALRPHDGRQAEAALHLHPDQSPTRHPPQDSGTGTQFLQILNRKT